MKFSCETRVNSGEASFWANDELLDRGKSIELLFIETINILIIKNILDLNNIFIFINILFTIGWWKSLTDNGQWGHTNNKMITQCSKNEKKCAIINVTQLGLTLYFYAEFVLNR